jgi:GNAT superfamily N-acetyltransferase
VESYPLVLRPATRKDLGAIRELVRDAADWLRTGKSTDQWVRPWPDRAGEQDRMRSDLAKGKTWLVLDKATPAATISIDTEGPLDGNEQPVWPEHGRYELALYVRRLVVGRHYAGRGLGAALLDWAADVAKREYGARLIRVDAWTTNHALHAYFEGQRFARRASRDPLALGGCPSQALFERDADQSGADYTRSFTEVSLVGKRRSGRRADGSAA